MRWEPGGNVSVSGGSECAVKPGAWGRRGRTAGGGAEGRGAGPGHGILCQALRPLSTLRW